ncbi:uncharacterized protein KIAA1143 homolog [Cyprinodon tularosa]|uniref:uncharacterized protein KIAA1143 homolog n=1 Tax=Cyprinodon variegatus TaxID=28743 RepID=UPI0007428AE2|nr:PREDICTED: uncharacterized protein KIAA1143 homolog [Cyprinodon variegatus]XP_038162183.1 uncharacterized protein KIAA1143 homolog [Cyprinodon tularosa]
MMNKGKASGVSWIKPAEPSFLKKFKTDVGYKEGPNVDTKRQVMPTLDDDDGCDREDELPQVVVLKSGDLTADEVKKLTEEMQGKRGKGEEALSEGKILFKKPAKRSSSDKFQGITASSSKKKNNSGEQLEKDRKLVKNVKNNSLLSFGGEEEEENE